MVHDEVEFNSDESPIFTFGLECPLHQARIFGPIPFNKDSLIVLDRFHVDCGVVSVHSQSHLTCFATSKGPLLFENQKCDVIAGLTSASNTCATGLRISICALATGASSVSGMINSSLICQSFEDQVVRVLLFCCFRCLRNHGLLLSHNCFDIAWRRSASF